MAGKRCKTTTKEYRCDYCGRLIPIGHKHWTKGRSHEHTNCSSYRTHEELAPTFNFDRSVRNSR